MQKTKLPTTNFGTDMSTYCNQTLTVKGSREDILALAPPGFAGYDLDITYTSESKGKVCFDVDALSKLHPKLIFILDTSIETWMHQRDVFFGGTWVQVSKVTGEENILKPLGVLCKKRHETGHTEFCRKNSYEDLQKLFQ